MNEYLITVTEHGCERQLTVEAETASAARDQVEESTDADVIALQFVRALTFSCRIRGGANRA
jgi:hypothetical protein